MMPPAFCAILVNYNAGQELRSALQSIADEAADESWEAVVVDNASTDGSSTAVMEFGPNVRLLTNSENVGFGRGVNQALATTTAPLVLIMNPDCRFVPGALATMRVELLAHESCALVGPRILDPDGTEQGSARGDPDMMTGLFGRASTLRRLLPWLPISRRNVVSDAPRDEESMIVDWVSGACMLSRRGALASVNGFDARYFLYWEDADLCRRLRARGYHIRHVPAATAVHQVGHSSRTARAASIRAFHESAYLYYTTHVATGGLARAVARTLLAIRCWIKLRRT